MESMVRRCVKLYGGLDYAFNNAGISGAFSPLADYDPDTWNDVIAVNLSGVFLSMKYEIPEMIRRGGGSIVNLASAAGIKSSPDVGPAYNASKHGIVGLSKGAALQYAPKGIRINVVCPGLIRTPLSDRTLLSDEATARAIIAKHPIGRAGEPREVTSLVLWLCSSESAFVTGAVIPVDGGLVLSLGPLCPPLLWVCLPDRRGNKGAYDVDNGGARVYRDDGCGDERCIVACKKGADAGYLAGLAEPMEGYLRGDHRNEALAIHTQALADHAPFFVHQVRLYASGADSVASYVVGPCATWRGPGRQPAPESE